MLRLWGKHRRCVILLMHRLGYAPSYKFVHAPSYMHRFDSLPLCASLGVVAIRYVVLAPSLPISF